MTRLTKDDILRSRSRTEYYEIEELGGEIPLRPLTDTQWNNVQSAMMAGMKGRGVPGQKDVDMEFDIGQIQQQMHKARCLAISYAIGDSSHWSIAEIEKADWPPGTVDKISDIVFKITGVEFSTSEVHRFRGERGRTGNSQFAILRNSIGGAAGGIDDATIGVFENSNPEGDGWTKK